MAPADAEPALRPARRLGRLRRRAGQRTRVPSDGRPLHGCSADASAWCRCAGQNPPHRQARTSRMYTSSYNIGSHRVTTCPLPTIRRPRSAGLCASWAPTCAMRGAGGGCRCRSLRTGHSRPGRPCSGSKRGTTGSAWEIYASVIHALGLLDGLGDVADWRRDEFGHALMTAELPRRARSRRPPGKRPDD